MNQKKKKKLETKKRASKCIFEGKKWVSVSESFVQFQSPQRNAKHTLGSSSYQKAEAQAEHS